jgi:hypothetical protein
MRQYLPRHPSRSSATQDPCLHGVGHGLEQAYADLLGEALPEDWKRLADRLAERVDAPEAREES